LNFYWWKHIQIDHISVDRRQELEGLTVIMNHCLVVAKHRERLLVNKRATQKSDVQRFDLKKLNIAEVKEERESGQNLKQVCSYGRVQWDCTPAIYRFEENILFC
jgi:hypothetical protein